MLCHHVCCEAPRHLTTEHTKLQQEAKHPSYSLTVHYVSELKVRSLNCKLLNFH